MTPEEFFQILRDAPEPLSITYRLYYDDAGCVLFYSMENLPGDWISVDAATYAQARHDVVVKNGTLVELPKISQVYKLRPGPTGTACDPRDICLVVDESKPNQKWNINHEPS